MCLPKAAKPAPVVAANPVAVTPTPPPPSLTAQAIIPATAERVADAGTTGETRPRKPKGVDALRIALGSPTDSGVNLPIG